MTLPARIKQFATILAVVVAGSLIVGSLLGQPVLLSFVETGSMEPTLSPGDGFIAVPADLTGAPSEGDVVVFQAERLHGGGLVTHRVVGETERGYITQGDANAFTDQSGDEPPVKDAQVVAVALTVQGDVIVLPNLGDGVGAVHSVFGVLQRTITSVTGVGLQGGQGFAITTLLVMLIWYGFEIWKERSSNEPNRDKSRETTMSGHTIVLGLTALIVLGATMAMVGPSGTTEYSVISAQFDEPGTRIIPTGHTETVNHSVGNGGVLPVIVFFETSDSNIDIQPSQTTLGGQSLENATVSLTAPPQTGQYRHFVIEHRYLTILPEPVITALYRIHPWLPIVVIDLLVALPYYVVGLRLVGTTDVRLSRRTREKPLLVRARRRLRQLY